jgi:amidase
MTDPSLLSASEARGLIALGELSPTELLEACIRRIEEVNPQINAIVSTDLVRARKEAKIAETAVLAGSTLPPLHGLPIGIKDLNATEGLRTTWGSKLFENFVPTEDEALVARLRAAGGIIIGKTNISTQAFLKLGYL